VIWNVDPVPVDKLAVFFSTLRQRDLLCMANSVPEHLQYLPRETVCCKTLLEKGSKCGDFDIVGSIIVLSVSVLVQNVGTNMEGPILWFLQVRRPKKSLKALGQTLISFLWEISGSTGQRIWFSSQFARPVLCIPRKLGHECRPSNLSLIERFLVLKYSRFL